MTGTHDAIQRRRLLVAAAAAACSPAPAWSQPATGALEVYDTYQDTSWPSPRWTRFRSAQYDFWDPAAAVKVVGGANASLAIDLPQFTQSHPNHVKALLLSTRAFDLPADGTWVVKVPMRVRIDGTGSNPFGLPAGDVRLAAGALVVIDPETGMVFDFFVSNDRIQPLYERLPSARAQWGDYPAFTILGKALPTAANEWRQYEIRYERAAGAVEWWVDGRRLARQERIGAPPGQDGPLVTLRKPRIGGGLFTLLDALADDRARADDHPRQKGFIASNWDDRFGQGGRMEFGPFATGTL